MRSSIGIRGFLAFAPAVVFACAAPRFEQRGSSNSQFITEDEVAASRGANAYEVIQELRPNFLSYRGETSLLRSRSKPYPTVYVDGQELGPIGSLTTISGTDISTIRLYRSWEATTIFGSGKMGGVIAVTTRR